MSTLHFPAKPILGALAAIVLFTSTGCPLPHADLRYSNLSPAQYCPGDVLTARFDIAGSRPCVSHSGLDCAALAPTVNVTSTSMALPAYAVSAFADMRTFAPTEDSVSVTFRPTPGHPSHLLYPYRDEMGNNRVSDRVLKPETVGATRFVDGTAVELTHGGMCNGNTPVNASASLPGAPQASSRLIAQQICNSSTVPIIVAVGNAMGGGGASGMLEPGGCLPLGFPSEGGMVSATPLAIAPGTQCSAVQNSTPPPTLKTRVILACRN